MQHMLGLETKNSGLAIFLSFIIPGLGQLYAGKVVRGVTMLLLTFVIYGTTIFCFRENSRTLQFINNTIAIETGATLHRSFQEAWGEMQPLVRQASWLFLGGVASAILSLFWWAWSMVDARKLCEANNRRVYELAHAGLRPNVGVDAT